MNKFEFNPLYSGGTLHVSNHPEPVIIDISGWIRDPPETRYEARMQHSPIIVIGECEPYLSANADGTPCINAKGVFNHSLPATFLQNLLSTGKHFESSIRTEDPYEIDYEYIPKDTPVKVNGKTFIGPCKILRRWKFLEGSFVYQGGDAYNSAMLAAAASCKFPLEKFLREGTIMSEELRQFIISLGYTEPEQLTPEQADMAERAFKKYSENCNVQKKTPTDLHSSEKQSQQAVADNIKKNDENKTTCPITVTEQPCYRMTSRTATEESIGSAIEDSTGSETEESDENEKNKKGSFAASAPVKNPARNYAIGNVGNGASRPSKNEIIEAALLMNIGLKPDSVAASGIGQNAMNEATSKSWRNTTLSTMLKMALEERTGRRIWEGCDYTEEAFSMLHNEGRNPVAATNNFSTISPIAIMKNVLNKTFLESWTNFQSAIDKIAYMTTNNDLRKGYFVDYDISGNLKEIGESGEIKSVTLAGNEITTLVKEYGFNFTLTEKMIINDDLGAFARLPKKIADKIRRHRERMGIKTLMDGLSTLCTSGHGNAITDTLSVDGLSNAKKALAQMKTIGSTTAAPEFTQYDGKYLFTSPSLEPTAKMLFVETKCDLIQTASTSNSPRTNPFVNAYEPVSSPYFSSAYNSGSDTAWLMITDPQQCPAIIISHLKGQETPRIEQTPSQPDMLGFSWRCVHREGYDLGDYRAIVKSTGSGD